MNARISLPERIEEYLAERRRLGFELRHNGQTLRRFARYVKAVGHRGPSTLIRIDPPSAQGIDPASWIRLPR